MAFEWAHWWKHLHRGRAVGSDGDYVTPAPTGEEDPGPEDAECASCSQIKPTISQKQTRVYMNTNVKNTAWHTHTQTALCLDNLTANHHGNCTLKALCASLSLHISLCLSVIYRLSRHTKTDIYNIKPASICNFNNNNDTVFMRHLFDSGIQVDFGSFVPILFMHSLSCCLAHFKPFLLHMYSPHVLSYSSDFSFCQFSKVLSRHKPKVFDIWHRHQHKFTNFS